MNDHQVDIREYLLQFAQLRQFWILRTEDIQPGLIHFLGADGTAYVLMDDDDGRSERCIEYLLGLNCPSFANVNEMNEYAVMLAKTGGCGTDWAGASCTEHG